MGESTDSQNKPVVDNELLLLLIASATEYALFVLDPTGHIVTWNPGAQRIKGYAPEEIIGKHFSIFDPAQEVRRGKPDYELRTATARARLEDEGWRVRKDGSSFWANVVITALRNADGAAGLRQSYPRPDRTKTRLKRSARRSWSWNVPLSRNRGRCARRLEAIQSVTEIGITYMTVDDLLTAFVERIGDSLFADTICVYLRDGGDNETLVRPRGERTAQQPCGPHRYRGPGIYCSYCQRTRNLPD